MGHPLILIVEDEPVLRQYTVTMLEEAGFDTLEADSAEAVVAPLESNSDIHALFIDIDLPGGTDGLRLAAGAGTERPVR